MSETLEIPEEPTIECVICPFCKEDGFDLVGLKSHFRDCDIYERAKTLPFLFWTKKDT